MPKSKNHTTHNQFQKWHRNSIMKPDHKDMSLLKGSRLQSPDKHVLCQEAQYEGPEEGTSQQPKAVSACAEAIKALLKPRRSSPRSQRWQLQAQLTCLHHSLLAWETCSCHIAKCLRLCQPKSKAKAKVKAQYKAHPGLWLQVWLRLQQLSKLP